MTDHETARPGGVEPDAGPAGPRFTAPHLLAVVRHGDTAARLEVAGEENMPAEGFALLARDPDPAVRAALLTNAAAPQVALEEMLERFPESRPTIATHPNAPMKLMETAPLATHTPASVGSYLRRRAASESQRSSLLEALAGSGEHGSTITLGDAWAQAKQATGSIPA